MQARPTPAPTRRPRPLAKRSPPSPTRPRALRVAIFFIGCIIAVALYLAFRAPTKSTPGQTPKTPQQERDEDEIVRVYKLSYESAERDDDDEEMHALLLKLLELVKAYKWAYGALTEQKARELHGKAGVPDDEFEGSPLHFLVGDAEEEYDEPKQHAEDAIVRNMGELGTLTPSPEEAAAQQYQRPLCDLLYAYKQSYPRSVTSAKATELSLKARVQGDGMFAMLLLWGSVMDHAKEDNDVCYP